MQFVKALRTLYIQLTVRRCALCNTAIGHEETFCADHLEDGKEMQRW